MDAKFKNKVEELTDNYPDTQWSVNVYEQSDNQIVCEFEARTPAGYDLIVPIVFKAQDDCDSDMDNLIYELREYSDTFDPEEETYLWLDETGHGKNGAPYHMRDLLSDMESAQGMIDCLYSYFHKAA